VSRPRSITVARREAGQSLGQWLQHRLELPWASVRQLLHNGCVRINGKPCTDARRQVARGQRIDITAPTSKPRTQSEPRMQRSRASGEERTSSGPLPIIRFCDAHIVVVEKPAGLTTMRHAEEAAEFGARGKRFLPSTLADLLPGLLAQRGEKQTRVFAVHRLDKETSGLVVFARTKAAESHLGKQFRAHTTDRRYLALVRGAAESRRIESWLVRDRGDGRRGSAAEPTEGQHAVTHVEMIERLGDFTLVECRLESGRTHQVRIHLGEQGWPLCGERIYDRPLHGRPLPDGSNAPRIALHAARLGFVHPASGEQVVWESPLPEDLQEVLERLRKLAADRTISE
jgi:23S rRNA pseudouridine1911/1915/1917 synthase